jgi:glycosyltransferase involved in cell wall biosynthesis
MIAILHGYLLEGSGGNLWTRSIVQSLCKNGETIHLMCQENHPELYDFICEAIAYHPNGIKETILTREPLYPGKCILHKPMMGKTLPVYVYDKYEEYSDVQPMINLDDAAIEKYIKTNIEVLTEIVMEYPIKAIHANHVVLMSVVARHVAKKWNIPYAIMPHGSAIEYAVKKDIRFFKYAESALQDSKRIYVIGKEIRNRVKELFTALPEIEFKMVELNLGVNTTLFKPVKVINRKENIQQLCRLLENVPRGKTDRLLLSMLRALKANISKEELMTAIEVSAGYDSKLADDQVEKKLQMIDWDNEKIILYVGRLIASKGLHSIVTALPEILSAEPNTRLIVVGHGPQREPIEAFIWALQHGHSELVQNIVHWGRALENDGERSLEETQLYFDHLKKSNALEDYFLNAQKYMNTSRIIFTGYLTHRELCYLFPSCDVSIFPSVVAEAGPLVFLEALASGCFPIGTYFAGMGASIDSVSQSLPQDVAKLMKLSPQADQTVLDIVANVKKALYVDDRYKQKLREMAIEKYDWKNVSKKLSSDLNQLNLEAKG